jgi:secreted protein acidic and rich in cysteine
VNGDTAECICIPECPEETDPRRKVCTNRNETWSSDCEVHRNRCFCDTNDARCSNPKNSHIHIDYYGECKEIQVN